VQHYGSMLAVLVSYHYCSLLLISCEIRNKNRLCVDLWQVWLVVELLLYMILFIILQKASH